MDDLVGLEPAGSFVEKPGGQFPWLPIDDAQDEIRIPTSGAGSVELGGGGRMVRVAVVDPNQFEAFRPRLVVRMEEFERVDNVPTLPILRCDVLRATYLDDTSRLVRVAEEKSATLLGERVPRVVLDGTDDRLRNLDRHGAFSQYRSPRYIAPPSGKTATMSPSRIRSASRMAASNAAPLEVPTRQPSSRASCRTAACASSVATDIVSSARVGSQIPGTRELSRCFTPSIPWKGPSGWTATKAMRRSCFLRNRPTPTNVPVVPRQATKCVMRPRVWSQISGPVDSRCARQFASLLYWSRYQYVFGWDATSRFAASWAPSVPSEAGVRTSSAPYASRFRRRSRLTFVGTHSVARYPSAEASIAIAIPVLPEVASRSTRFFVSPAFSAARSIPSAARSLTLPPGLNHSAFAKIRTPGAACAAIRSSGRSGVCPIRSARRETSRVFPSPRVRRTASRPDIRLLPEGELQDVQGEEGALETDRAERDSELLQDRLPIHRLRVRDRDALEHRRQHRGARLADRAALALEAHLGDAGRVDFQVQHDLVAAQRIRVVRIVRRVG